MLIVDGKEVPELEYLWVISDTIVLALTYIIFVWKRYSSLNLQAIQKDQTVDLDRKRTNILSTETKFIVDAK